MRGEAREGEGGLIDYPTWAAAALLVFAQMLMGALAALALGGILRAWVMPSPEKLHQLLRRVEELERRR